MELGVPGGRMRVDDLHWLRLRSLAGEATVRHILGMLSDTWFMHGVFGIYHNAMVMLNSFKFRTSLDSGYVNLVLLECMKWEHFLVFG